VLTLTSCRKRSCLRDEIGDLADAADQVAPVPLVAPSAREVFDVAGPPVAMLLMLSSCDTDWPTCTVPKLRLAVFS